MKYLKLPIDFSGMLHGKTQKRCSVEESIAQYIMMQITSRYGEVAGRNDFGSDIWELEFNQLVKIYEWEEKVRLSLLESITKYETRLTDINVVVSLSEIDTDVDSKKHSEVRRKAVISVSGNIVQTGVAFNFNTSLYVSPLSQ
ncbi:GPW/gp25 family protein [Aquimarina muelleri]|uniref:Lysozyme n=1 Tax=Aquimarina muelleri TaxID=279356 RepID=A0A918N5P3_9FLAO|nr:GPW/gp25 family protein [Aquimarina muelleri]MCX2764492.1 GPW/gp25 family protein [Aquimarina muelleri]GGX30705.1 lysozyme [Aquimarina muelleri]